MLTRLAPLPDGTVRGQALLPVLVEAGADLVHHFDLDASRLAEIINEGADASRKVDAGDIQLIAMSGTHTPYAQVRFAVIGRDQAVERAHPVEASVTDTLRDRDDRTSSMHAIDSSRAHGAAYRGELSAESTRQSLRQYIYEKYLFAQPAVRAGGGTNGA